MKGNFMPKNEANVCVTGGNWLCRTLCITKTVSLLTIAVCAVIFMVTRPQSDGPRHRQMQREGKMMDRAAMNHDAPKNVAND